MKNKMMRTMLLMMTMAGAMLFASGCGNKEEAAPAEETVEESAEETGDAVTFIDMADREVVIDEPVEKIVVLTAADCEILYELGVGDLVIGRGEYCNYPEEVLDVEMVSSGSETNIEQIIALQPDTVFMSTMDQSEEHITALENAGITVVMSNADSIDETYTCIEMIGKAVGKEDNASALVEEMKANFAEIAEKAKDKDPKSVYFEVSPLEYGLWTTGAGTFMDEMAETLGLENIFGDVEGWAEISEEQVLERNPDYIFTVTMYFGEGPTPEEEIMGRAGWENVTAVKNGTVYPADNDQFTRPGPRLDDALADMYEKIYGEE